MDTSTKMDTMIFFMLKRIDIFRNSSDCRCCFFSCESSAQEPIASLLSNHRVTLAVAPLLDNHGCTGASANHRSCATAQRHAASNGLAAVQMFSNNST